MPPSARIQKKSQVERVYDALGAIVSAPSSRVGMRLAPVRSLAERLGASVPTVQRAMARLEEEGRIERRHGSGVYVASPQAPLPLEQAVAVCMQGGADVFGQLAAMICRDLHDLGRYGTMIDTTTPDRFPDLMRGISQTAVSALVIQGNLHFPFALLTDPLFRRKPIIGVVGWETKLELDNVWPVVADHEYGTRQLADHLMALGHRHILIVGMTLQIWFLDRFPQEWDSMPSLLARAWKERGGSWETLTAKHVDPRRCLDAAELLPILDRPDGPTALVCLMDSHAFGAQLILQRERPDLLQKLTITGYYNTHWSEAGLYPTTTVDLNLQAMSRSVIDRIREVTGKTPPPRDTVRIPPRLLIRESSKPAP